MRVGQSKPDYFFCPRKSSSIDLHIIHDITVIIPALRQADVTTDMTTSHLTNPAKDAGQVIGYSHSTDETPSHSTRLSKNDNQVAGYRLSKNDSQVAGYQGERLPYGII